MPQDKKPTAFWGAAATLLVATVSWAYSTGVRVSAIETRQALMEERQAVLEKTITEERDVLQRIDSRLSHMEGTLDQIRGK